MRNILSGIFSTLIVSIWSMPSMAIDWDQVKNTNVTLFYPAQLSWEYLWDSAEHSGAKKLKDGRGCRSCHDGKEEASGALIVDYTPTEPHPIAGKPGSIKASVKTAYDAENLFIRVSFDTSNQPSANMDADFSDKLSIMIDDGSVDDMTRTGCWVACHDDAYTMKKGTSDAITKHLSPSMPSETASLEYWQARLAAGKVTQFYDGVIRNKRSEQKSNFVKGDARFENGTWTVTFSRKLNVGTDHKIIQPGKSYTIGLSIHAGYTTRRFHYVSLEKTLMLDREAAEKVAADFIAKRQ